MSHISTAGRTSVVIPVYNGQDYLGQALCSVLRQIRPVREIIIIDDGSMHPVYVPIHSPQIPIRLIRTENRGLGPARNLAASFCTGEYLALLDCDDLWHPKKIALQEEALDKNPHAILCYTRVRHFPRVNTKSPTYTGGLRKSQLKVLWQRNYILPSSVMVRRSAWLRAGGGDPHLSGVADWELWWRLAKLGSFAFLDFPLTFYRRHPGQMTKNLYNMLKEEVTARSLMHRRAYQLLRRLGFSSDTIGQVAAETRHFFYDYMIYHQRGTGAWREILLGLLRYTNELKAWKLFFRSLTPNNWITGLRNRVKRLCSS